MINTLNSIPRDKLLHFAIGVVIYLLINILTIYFIEIPDEISRNNINLLSVLIIGVLIEIYQKITKTGTPEILDAIAVLLGGGCMYVNATLT